MGPRESEPVIYQWPAYFHLSRLIPVAVLLALLLRAPNRTRSAWWILLPALALPFVASWALALSGLARYLALLDDVVLMFFFGLAFLWLLGDKLADLPRPTALVYAAWLLLLAGIIGLIGVSTFDPHLFLIPTAIAYGFISALAVIALALAGLACRKWYSPRRFLISLFVVIALGAGGVAMFFSLMSLLPSLLIEGEMMGWYMLPAMMGMLMGGLLGATVLFLLLLPFVALAIWNPAYRPRFYAIFRLPGMDSEQNTAYSEPTIGDLES